MLELPFRGGGTAITSPELHSETSIRLEGVMI